MKTFYFQIIVRKENKYFGYGLTMKGKDSDTAADKMRKFFQSEGYEIVDLGVTSK